MEGVEDIPGTVLAEGDRVRTGSPSPSTSTCSTAAPKIIDIGAQVPHAALRFYVMGERGGRSHRRADRRRDRARWASLLEEALARRRTRLHHLAHHQAPGQGRPLHAQPVGRASPSCSASPTPCGVRGRGVIEVNSDFGPGEFEILRAGRRNGRPAALDPAAAGQQCARPVARDAREDPPARERKACRSTARSAAGRSASPGAWRPRPTRSPRIRPGWRCAISRLPSATTG